MPTTLEPAPSAAEPPAKPPPAPPIQLGPPGGFVDPGSRVAGRWTPALGDSLDDFSPSSLVVDPRRPSTMFAAAGGAGLFASTDRGRTWLPLPFPAGRLDALAITARGPRVLYAGSSDGVFKSLDAGRTWQPAHSGMRTDRAKPRRDHDAWIDRLFVDPRHPDLVYAAGWGNAWRSEDGGSSWTQVSAWDDLTVDPQDAQVLYASTQRHVWRDAPHPGWNDGLLKSSDAAAAGGHRVCPARWSPTWRSTSVIRRSSTP